MPVARSGQLAVGRRLERACDGLDLDRISATFHDGVLTLTIPVAEHAKPRRIPVNADKASPRVIEASSTPASGGAHAS